MEQVTICDVAPRDGLQNHPRGLSVADRVQLVGLLADAGVPRIEVTSFVNPARVPRMAGAEEVVVGLSTTSSATFAGLVLNERGLDRLLETGLREVHFAFGCTDSFNLENQGMPVAESIALTRRLARRARTAGLRSTVTLAVAFGCPFDGDVDPGFVADVAAELASEVEELSLADTIGVATPRDMSALIRRVAGLNVPLGVHLHNTRNTGYANAVAAISAGATILDASLGGIGGCPFAPGASGNVATEDLVYLLEGEGVSTGIDFDRLVDAARWLSERLDERLEGQLHRLESPRM